MAEYIKIDKNTFPTFYKKNLTDYGKGWNACLKSVLQHKTADVVEVVRCRDCKHLVQFSAIDRQFYCRHHPQGLSGINIVEDNPFCSYGERKEDNVKKQNS